MEVGNLVNLAVASQLNSASRLTSSALARAKTTDTAVPPWSANATTFDGDAAIRSILAGKSFLPANAKTVADKDDDKQKLFAVYEGVRQLGTLADKAADKKTSDLDRARFAKRFTEGLAEVRAYVDGLELARATLLANKELSKAETAMAMARNATSYTGRVVHDGDLGTEPTAFQGNVQFNGTFTKGGSAPIAVSFDLGEMGSTPRTLDNVVTYLNGKLQAAGALTRFSREHVGETNKEGVIQGTQYALKVSTLGSEIASFSAPASDPALYVVGQSGKGKDAAPRISKLADEGASSAELFAERLEIAGEDFELMGSAVGPDGALYAVGRAKNAVDGTTIKGTSDAVLVKYDSAGRKMWSRTLGASLEGSAASIAVSDTGQIALTGFVKGEAGKDVALGGRDIVVSVYDDTGTEQWTRQRGARGDDEGLSIQFANDGAVFVAGKASQALSNTVTALGESDGFAEVFEADGALRFTRQFGTAGADDASAIAIAADGGLLVAGNENGRAVLRKYDALGNSDVPIWTHDLGDLGSGGRISGISVDETGAIFVAGTTRETAFAGATGHQGGLDGFVAKFTDNAASATQDWSRFIGSTSDDNALQLVARNGAVYVAGSAGDDLNGQTVDGASTAYAIKLDASNGATSWTKVLEGRGGVASGASLAFDATGASVLDDLGLPKGDMLVQESRRVIDRTSLRAGDHFYVSLDGGRKKKITLEERDTLRDVAYKINRAMGFKGKAEVRFSKGGDRLVVTPSEGHRIDLSAGSLGRDALKGLNLPEGAVIKRKPTTGDAAADAPKIYGLGLDPTLSLDDKTKSQTASEKLQKARSALRSAYTGITSEFLNGVKKPGKRGTTAPSYLTDQLANYSAGLQRLGG